MHEICKHSVIDLKKIKKKHETHKSKNNFLIVDFTLF